MKQEEINKLSYRISYEVSPHKSWGGNSNQDVGDAIRVGYITVYPYKDDHDHDDLFEEVAIQVPLHRIYSSRALR